MSRLPPAQIALLKGTWPKPPPERAFTMKPHFNLRSPQVPRDAWTEKKLLEFVPQECVDEFEQRDWRRSPMAIYTNVQQAKAHIYSKIVAGEVPAPEEVILARGSKYGGEIENC